MVYVTPDLTESSQSPMVRGAWVGVGQLAAAAAAVWTVPTPSVVTWGTSPCHSCDLGYINMPLPLPSVFSSGYALHAKCDAAVDPLFIESGGHNDLDTFPVFYSRLQVRHPSPRPLCCLPQ